MKEFAGCRNYTLVKKEELTDVGSTAYILKHDKTGARVCLISNDDENKALMIGFRTIPTDSTGVPHILEHAVLCGSEKYPVKDAMTEVGKGSLNTFMNAFTAPDRTLYPVASCNGKDFDNLFRVYLDAVFKPMVYQTPETFLQEGWHYELEDEEGDITINGVVYNEMRGVYSNPEEVCANYSYMSLFPDTQYGVESGGDPKYIPDLTYEEFINFHKRLYHPSNSRIFLYGDMDFEEKLKYIDEEYLSKYEMIDPHTEIKLQKPFDAPKYMERQYSLSEEESEKNAAFLTYNVVCSDYTETEINEAMNVINYALCSVPGAKLKERLIDAGIGDNVYASLIDDIGQPVFSIVAQNANAEDEERFVSIIEDTIREVIKEGFDRKTLEASITNQEFSYREADYGYYPRGIVYGMFVFDAWNYTDDDIFPALKQNAIFKRLREHLKDDFFERVLKERILENNHKTIMKVVPVKGLSAAEDKKLADKLKAYKDSLSKEEIIKLIEDTKALKAYQESEDSDEALATIPTLSINDIDRDIKRVEYAQTKRDGVTFIETEIFTNGIAYASVGFSLERLPKELYPYFSIAKIALGRAGTRSYSYGDLANEIEINTGSLSANTAIYKRSGDDFDALLEVKTKVLYEKIPQALKLAEEILLTTDFDDKKRLKEILSETRTKLKGYMISSGDSVSVSRLASYYSKSGALTEILSGMEQFRVLEDLLDDFDDKIDGFIEKMKEAMSFVVAKENLFVSVCAEKQGIEAFAGAFSDFLKNVPSKNAKTVGYTCEAADKEEAFTSASQVQYVGIAGDFKKAGLDYTSRLSVLRTILSSDYLWNNVRVLGGAYGAYCAFRRSGDAFMVSYRDPNLSKTVDVFKKAAEYIGSFPDDEELCERFVISAVGDLDTPLTPSMKAAKALAMYRTRVTNEMLKAERDELLSTNSKDIRDLAKYLEAITKDPYICCVGGEEAIDKDRHLFKEVLPLTRS
ncbi:MAG: insulinase family protein [Lachnospiraceae bacterium]|nr:insulinase family protein [Lachnospiraceae bacterium]